MDEMEAAGSLVPEHAQLMAQDEDLKLQFSWATTDGDDQNEDANGNCKHTIDDRTAYPTTLCFLRHMKFTTGTGGSSPDPRIASLDKSRMSSESCDAKTRYGFSTAP